MPEGVNRLSAMIQERKLTKEFFKSEEFRNILIDVQSSLYSEHKRDIWIALSIAGRASSVSKPAEAVFLPIIEGRLAKNLPELHILEDGEDRYYLAKALEYAPNEQIVDYAFSELSREDVAEKARRVWAKIAFENSPSRGDFLVRLNQFILNVNQEQCLTIDSLIRRIRRISSVISEDLATAEKPAGSEFGSALLQFYAGRKIANGPGDRDLREEAADEFIRCLARIIRLNFRVASDPTVYKILTVLRRWWRPVSPPEKFETMSRKVAYIGIETLHSFAREGIRNKRLRDAVVAACGKSVVNLLSKSIANADVSLPEDISYWFTHGSEQAGQKSTATIEYLSGKQLDDDVARLLIAISSPDSNHQALKSVADQVSVLMPEEANSLSRAASRLSQIKQWSRAIARSRNIKLMGEQGEVVAFDPAMHTSVEDCIVGSDVVVVTPGAIKANPGRPQVLITKIEVRSR